MMKLVEFAEIYDKPGMVVLLEGKRKVAEDDRPKLIAFGELVAGKTRFITFRSGNAPGADELFSQGVSKISPERIELITPYSGHRKSRNSAYSTVSIDEINLAKEPEIVYGSKSNKDNERLIDAYVAGRRDKVSIKAAYLLRDTLKVTGASFGIAPASFAIFYDDLSKPETGGTGHTMKVCRKQSVPFITQETWFNWLE